jgi:two-component system response regulator AtoC
MITRTTITEDELESRAAGGEGLHVLVISPELFIAQPLPDEGTLVIGRSPKSDVLVEDPLASRQHARLQVGPTLTIEDLESANGTRVRDAMLEPGQPVTITPGEAIGIGSTVLIIQRSRWTGGPRRLWSHGHFENRLKDECARGQGAGSKFALLRLHLEGNMSWTRVFPVMSRNIQSPHLFATYGPNEYEALLLEANVETAERVVEVLWADLRHSQLSARIGMAWYPRDGRTADALLARANALLKPSPAKVTMPGPHVPSPVMQRVYDVATRAAGSNINLLLLGETGAGKEVMAQMVHRLSPRSAKPIVSLNCAGLTDSLIETELFGHEKGAFTGATQSRPGLLETADGGTVFLDEIGEMPLKVQATLLRVIETREVLPVGGRRPRSIDVRFIAATNRDLEAESARGHFRQDLFFRLNGISLHLPPLRERRSEIFELARIFVAQACHESGRPALTISDAARASLEAYGWPGNIRELKNVMERAVVLTDGTEIGPAQLPLEKMGGPEESTGENELESRPPEVEVTGTSHKADLRAVERQRIIDALAACAGNQSRAAKLLNMPRRTFISKLDLYDIPRPQKGKGGSDSES